MDKNILKRSIIVIALIIAIFAIMGCGAECPDPRAIGCHDCVDRGDCSESEPSGSSESESESESCDPKTELLCDSTVDPILCCKADTFKCDTTSSPRKCVPCEDPTPLPCTFSDGLYQRTCCAKDKVCDEGECKDSCSYGSKCGPIKCRTSTKPNCCEYGATYSDPVTGETLYRGYSIYNENGQCCNPNRGVFPDGSPECNDNSPPPSESETDSESECESCSGTCDASNPCSDCCICVAGNCESPCSGSCTSSSGCPGGDSRCYCSGGSCGSCCHPDVFTPTGECGGRAMSDCHSDWSRKSCSWTWGCIFDG